jgi:deazaflavin-dependent oxidoreductase (nitroreductase family)
MMTDQLEFNRKLIEEFRATRGAPDGPYANRPIVLLTTTGAKSGQARTAPVMYVRDGERLLVIASNAGAPSHPQWYRNLIANPALTVEVGTETYPAHAKTISGAERVRLWELITSQYPFFKDHQAKISREIPVVELVRDGE